MRNELWRGTDISVLEARFGRYRDHLLKELRLVNRRDEVRRLHQWGFGVQRRQSEARENEQQRCRLDPQATELHEPEPNDDDLEHERDDLETDNDLEGDDDLLSGLLPDLQMEDPATPQLQLQQVDST